MHDLLCFQAVTLMEMHPPLTVNRNTSLLDAARHMLVNHVHRLWVVPTPSDATMDTPDAPVLLEGLGVLTLTDILRAIYISESN